jgi:carbon storage regulator
MIASTRSNPRKKNNRRNNMLVLTRKENQTIRIGPDIVITVCKMLSKGQVRIGIDAPKEMNIVRGELPHVTAQQPAEDDAG